MDEKIKNVYDAVLAGEADAVKENIQISLDAGLDPNLILNEGMIGAMREVGQRFEAGDFFVPEMLISARAMQGGMALLKPHLQKGGVQSSGKVVIGTVKGDIHNIGKDIVVNLLRAANYDVCDLGVDVPPQKFVEAVADTGATVVGLSGLLTVAFDSMKETADALAAAGLRPNVRVMVGGGSITEKVQHYTGADAWGADAQSAVSLCNQWIKEAAR